MFVRSVAIIKLGIFRCNLNPCPSELVVTIFPSFKARIAHANSSFKWRKNIPVDV